MNFLQLAQRLHQEAGLSGSGPTTTVDQVGILKQVVDWINTAYIDVQSQHAIWHFMQDDFSFQTTASKREYSIADTGVTDLETWKLDDYGSFRVYLTSSGVANEQYMYQLLWDDYRQMYLYGATRTAEGLPNYVSVQPDEGLNLYLVPDDIYTIVGEYYKVPAELSGDTDVPIIPSQFHMIIVWRALMFYAGYDAANEKYAMGKTEYKKLLMRLEIDQLPQITFGGPLA
ncbi:MAG: hypothetical protein GY845_03360 [Planctomycetes bacterium]|nr:hypothetical protein [Planctomycetota bacterium]